jgi:hypothetical protein
MPHRRSADSRVTRGDQHVQETVHVRVMRGERIGQRTRHRPERRLVQHHIDARACTGTGRQIADVTLDELDVPALGGRYAGNTRRVAQMPGRRRLSSATTCWSA